MSSEPPPPSTGLIAGKYELLGMIGRGGMGSVWEGRHASLGTRVAIKFIESEYAESQEARARFDNEARAAATIQSKHAIQIHDHGVTHDGKPYIVMELLIGEPLDKRIERLGRLSLQDTARILQQVCRGLHRAHERGIIHRDLKPENIFLVRSDDDDDEVAKVLDFGIAKIKAPQGMGISSSTKTGAVLGTPFFMSPEQARGLRNVDHRTDIWSLAVIAFKCVTGVLPFDGESVGDLLVKICTAPPPVPSHVVPGLPLAFDAWFARALDREPERRFSSALELSDALAYAAGVSVRRVVSSGTPEIRGVHPTLSSATPSPGGTLRTPAPMHDPITGSSRASLPGAQGAGATSAPFTQSTPTGVPRPGRGLTVLATVMAAFLLSGAGFFGVTRYQASRKATPSQAVPAGAAVGISQVARPSLSVSPGVAGGAMPPAAPNASPAADAGGSSTPPPPSGSAPAAPKVKPTRPAGVKPAASGAVRPPPPLPPVAPPPTVKPPIANDPGY